MSALNAVLTSSQGNTERKITCRSPTTRNQQAMRALQTSVPAQHQAGCPVCLPAPHRLGKGHRHPSQSRKQCLRMGAAAEGSAKFTNEATVRPKSAETARTIVEVVSHGTLSTVGEDGTPLGTYSSFVLDSAGMPILRLRRDAVHTANLKAQPRCSLFVQPGECEAAFSTPCLPAKGEGGGRGERLAFSASCAAGRDRGFPPLQQPGHCSGFVLPDDQAAACCCAGTSVLRPPSLTQSPLLVKYWCTISCL